MDVEAHTAYEASKLARERDAEYLADYSAFHEATGWVPEIELEEGIELVCEPYQE